MGFQVLPADALDLPEMNTLYHDVFEDNDIRIHLWPNVPKEESLGHQLRRYFKMSTLDDSRFVKAVDSESGKIVAFAKWQYPHTLTTEQYAAKEAADRKADEENPLPAGTNKYLYDEFFGALKKRRELFLDDSKDYYLDILAVSTTHQRQGLGALLLDEGLAIADEHNAKTYLEASPAGLKLYKKYGWKDIDEILVDLKPYGGSGHHSEICMMRQAGGK